ncbi:MAG: TraB/GumN family protein [Bernardetiaceae bacterium]|nr:TraB/GumN family protein [Bernardetiaceae bacterium]
MRKISLILMSALALLLSFAPQKSVAQLLWKISSDELAKDSYLYGTMHVTDDRAFILKDTWYPLITEECDVIAGELDMGNLMAMSMKMMTLAKMPNDTTLADLYTDEEYELVMGAIKDSPLSNMSQMFNTMKPIFISTMLSEAKRSSQEGKKPKHSEALDAYMQTQAKKHKKEVIGLETIDEQLVALESMTLKEQADLLYQSIASESENNEGESEMEKMMRLYVAQDINSLYELTTSSLSAKASGELLSIRNHRMAERLGKALQENKADKSYFVGIGAAHLAGEEGVIELLRKQGYKVEPIDAKPSEVKEDVKKKKQKVGEE